MCGWLQECGHADFCFPCVQGLTTCPTCDSPIKGWHLLQTKSPPIQPLVLSLKAAFNSKIKCHNSTGIIRKNKKRELQCLESAGDELIVGGSSLADSDDDDAGLLTWAASCEKQFETQDSNLQKGFETQDNNLESEPQGTTTVDNTLQDLPLPDDSQGTQDDHMNFPKKKKKNPTQPAPFPRVQTRLRGTPGPIKGKKMMKLS